MYDLDPVYGCHLWRGPLDSWGYGNARVGGRARKAHWVAFEAATGTCQRPGVELDHTCRRRHCVNPLHLDPVTRSENQRRTNAWRRRLHERCPQGHRLTETTRLDTPEGGWVCRLCLPPAALSGT